MAFPPALKSAIRDVAYTRRGFDDEHPGALPHMSLNPDRPLDRQPLEDDDVRGTFAAIASLATWWVWHEECDPRDEEARHAVAVIAQELEDLARALRRAADHYEDETETT